MIVHYDCRYFVGHKPCIFKRECEACPHFRSFGKRILIIKLAAIGDVLRTTPLLRGLLRAYPTCHITWVTESKALPMLEGVPGIDRLLPAGPDTALQLQTEVFDEMFCLDKEPSATALAMNIRAERKVGFGMSAYGNVMPLNTASEYIFELGINNSLKFRTNTKTYPELMFECAELPYPEPQEYVFPDLLEEIRDAGLRLQSLGAGAGKPKVGLSTGAGDVFATKKWTETGYVQLANQVIKRLGATVLLLGGPAEKERNARIAAAAEHPLVDTGSDNSLRRFAGIVGNCDLLVTGDTLAMHLAIGLGVPVVVILGSTCHQEIELYGRGEKIISDFDCSPCYLSTCPKEISCMEAMGSDVVFEAVSRLLTDAAPRRGSL